MIANKGSGVSICTCLHGNALSLDVLILTCILQSLLLINPAPRSPIQRLFLPKQTARLACLPLLEHTKTKQNREPTKNSGRTSCVPVTRSRLWWSGSCHDFPRTWTLSGVTCAVLSSTPAGACHSQPGFAACRGKERASNASAPAWPMHVCVPASRTPLAGSAPCTLCPGRTTSDSTHSAWQSHKYLILHLQVHHTHQPNGDTHTTTMPLQVSGTLDKLWGGA